MLSENCVNKNSVLGLQYEPVSLYVSKVCLGKKPDLSNTHGQSTKNQSDNEWY